MANVLTHTEIAALLTEAGATLFSYKSCEPKRNAQANLLDHTHYVDDSTLKYFGARVYSANDDLRGLIFYIIESIEGPNGKREHRFVVFDVFGTVIERPELGQGSRSSADARSAYRVWLQDFDIQGHYAQAMSGRMKELDRQHTTARHAAVRLEK